jgi:hypothetical protein
MQPMMQAVASPATSIVSPIRRASSFGAEGASASMADRAVRAARL